MPPPKSNRSLMIYTLSELLDISSGMGSLREGQRHIEHRLGSLETSMASLQQTLTSRTSMMHHPTSVPVTPPSPATGTLMQVGRKALAWGLGRLLIWAMSYLAPVMLILLGLAWKWAAALWRLLVG